VPRAGGLVCGVAYSLNDQCRAVTPTPAHQAHSLDGGLRGIVRCAPGAPSFRHRRSACRFGCSTDFFGTKRIYGQATASQIAAASRASFFCLFRYRLTNCGASNRTSCPKIQSHEPSSAHPVWLPVRPHLGRLEAMHLEDMLRRIQSDRLQCHSVSLLAQRSRLCFTEPGPYHQVSKRKASEEASS
jgi:hypothetical protein